MYIEVFKKERQNVMFSLQIKMLHNRLNNSNVHWTNSFEREIESCWGILLIGGAEKAVCIVSCGPSNIYIFFAHRKHVTTTIRLLRSSRFSQGHQRILRKQAQVRVRIVAEYLIPIRFGCVVVCTHLRYCHLHYWFNHVDHPLCYWSFWNQVSRFVSLLICGRE